MSKLDEEVRSGERRCGFRELSQHEAMSAKDTDKVEDSDKASWSHARAGSDARDGPAKSTGRTEYLSVVSSIPRSPHPHPSSLLIMPRRRTTTLSKRRLECFTRDQLFSEIYSITSTPHLSVSWGSIFSRLFATPVLDDLSDLQHVLESVRNDQLIDCALTLRATLESAHECASMLSTRKVRKQQRSSSAIRVTTSENWLRARERRIQKALQSSRQNGAQRETTEDTFGHKLQDAQALAANHRAEMEGLRARLQNSEQEKDKYEQQLWASKVELHQIATGRERTNTELIGLRQQMKAQEIALGRLQTDLDRAVETETLNQNALHETKIQMRQKATVLTTMLETLRSCEAQRDELRAQRDGLEAALRITKNERKSAQYRLTDDSSTVPQQQSAFSDGGICVDAITSWTDNTIGNGSRSPSPCLSAEGSTSLHSGPISGDGQNVQIYESSGHPTCVTNSDGMDGDGISVPAGLPPRCCDRIPVARTNAGCELCLDHCEQFTWFSPAEMGMDPRDGVVTCPACNGPGCESAELSSCSMTN